MKGCFRHFDFHQTPVSTRLVAAISLQMARHQFSNTSLKVLFRQLLRTKISTKDLPCRNRYFCIVVAFSEQLDFEKVNFPENKQSALSTFLGEPSLSRAAIFFKRRYILQQLPFQKSYFLTTYFFRRVAISLLCFFYTATLTIYQSVIR